MHSKMGEAASRVDWLLLLDGQSGTEGVRMERIGPDLRPNSSEN